MAPVARPDPPSTQQFNTFCFKDAMRPFKQPVHFHLANPPSLLLVGSFCSSQFCGLHLCIHHGQFCAPHFYLLYGCGRVGFSILHHYWAQQLEPKWPQLPGLTLPPPNNSIPFVLRMLCVLSNNRFTFI